MPFSPEFRPIRSRAPRPFTRPKGVSVCGRSPQPSIWVFSQGEPSIAREPFVVRDVVTHLSRSHGRAEPGFRTPGPNSLYEACHQRTVTPRFNRLDGLGNCLGLWLFLC